MCPKYAEGMANSAKPDQLLRKVLKEQSDLGFHCLHRSVCLKTLVHFSVNIFRKLIIEEVWSKVGNSPHTLSGLENS